MPKEAFRIGIGLSIITVHFLCLVIIFLFKDDYLERSERVSIALLLMPITASYVCAIVKSAIDKASIKPDRTRVNLNYALVVSVFTFFTLAGLVWMVFNLQGAQENDKQVILLFETAFGAAFGLIASDLFGYSKPDQ